jgi:hypothetical protein
LLSTWFVPPQISKWWSHGVAAVKIKILLLILISQFYDAFFRIWIAPEPVPLESKKD